jgi:hypothetical protein
MHAAHALKHVTERPVPQVVHERRGQAKQLIFLGDVERAAKLFDDPPGRLHHAEAMAVPRVIGPGIRQRRHSQLPNAAQALKLDAVEQPKQQGIRGPVQPERDHIVHRVADDLLTDGHRGSMLVAGCPSREAEG